MKDLNQLLHNTLTVAAFSELASQLSISDNRLSRLLKNPSRFELQHIKVLAKVLNTTPEKLVFEYKVGSSTLTHEDLDKIAAEAGYEVGLIAIAA